MLEKQVTIFNKYIVKPAKKNLASLLFWVGLFLIFLGAIFGTVIDSWQYIPSGTGEAILKGGSAILGAGVFAVIMKSSQFTELFQENIYDVFYRPAKLNTGVPLIEKWKIITNELLKEVLPSSHSEAAAKIEKQFFNSELEYHFEEHLNSYEVTIDLNTSLAIIKGITESTIILSPHAKNPILIQSIETDGDFKLIALRLNGKSCDTSELYKKDPENKNKNVLSLELNEYAESRVNTDLKVVRLERVVQWSQNLKEDPYIKGAIVRYVKGGAVKVKVTSGYKTCFERFGLGDMPKNNHLKDDGHGYEKWQLVRPDNLLLPGQGYILMFIPE